jgi:hypothetical protein
MLLKGRETNANWRASGRRCGSINTAPQLINQWQPAENSLAQCTKLIKPDHSTNSKISQFPPVKATEGVKIKKYILDAEL